ncbi:hypothetical protein QFC22_005951 [Naganishia vaughanmartiniae]|uniref:Uncharacterized protein n=1 Tax=Naganishia vaughanmartiniae TaxID=1424756 RepID=A0ACC2WQF9_9TREE|nr:hypothetical protein QFC22_005951 [Naganishia vaughanmartiniae]
MTVILHAKIVAKAEHAEAVKKQLLAIKDDADNKEEECLVYRVNQVVDDKNTFILFEEMKCTSPVERRQSITDLVHPSADTTSTPQSTAGSALETVAQALKNALPSTDATASNGDLQIGSLGILHPAVLDNFALVNPCSVLEINVEPFL